MDNNILLNVKDLFVWYKVFGGYLKVLNGINLIVREGERVGLVGEAGCGKTTTLKSILKILPPGDYKIPKGEIFYKGVNILRMNSKEIQNLRSKEIAMIFQDPTAALNPVFTIGSQIGDVIKYAGIFKSSKYKEQIRTNAIKALKEVYLPDPERMLVNYPFQLSGGMRQRVCIAMSICSPRNLIFADEPGTSLDVTIQDQIHRLLNNIVKNRNTAIILVTHSLGVAREMTDRIYVMYAGTIVEMATPEKLFKNPKHPYTKGLLASVPKISGGGISSGIPGKLPNYLKPPAGCRFQTRCEYKNNVCIECAPKLCEVETNHLVACHLSI
ncbi:MAG: ABC transporter ATP-binding protein [Candidatus Caldatribacteriota bacterium]